MLNSNFAKHCLPKQNISSVFNFAKNCFRTVSTEFQEQLQDLNFVDGSRGRPCRLHDCQVTTSVEPRSGRTVGEFHLSGADEVNRAVDNAKKGLELWKRTSDFDKSRVMRKAASLLRERKPDIVHLDAIDTGK